MNILLDRFPLETFLELKSKLDTNGHNVPLCVLTHQSKNLIHQVDSTYFFDRDIAIGLVTCNVPHMLNRTDIKKASKYEGIAISLFSRFSIDQKYFSAQEMSSHYYELYNFWTYQIIKYKIQFCFQHYIPHDPSSFVLYIVLKNNKIPVVFVDVPHIFNKYRPLACSFENRDLLLNCNKNSLCIDFTEESLNYQIQLKQGGINSIPKTIKFRYEKNKTLILNNLFKMMFLGFRKPEKIVNYILNIIKFRKSAGHFFKISRCAWSNSRSEFSHIQFYFFMKKIAFRLYFERKRYEEKCISSIPGKYIYFAMSAQPEGTTLPTALEFRDIFIVLRILREVIPFDVPILFKENPSVFEMRNPYLSAVGYRSPDFYRRLLEIPNLKLVSSSVNSHDLIKNSLMVATINGTAAVESVYFGVPAVTFGSNWYDKINGIHKYQSISGLTEFYSKVDRGLLAARPIDSKLMIDKEMIVQFEDHNAYEFQGDARRHLIEALIASIAKFSRLDDRKWSF